MKKALILIAVLTLSCSKLKKYEARIDYGGSSARDHFQPYETWHMWAGNDTQAYSNIVEDCYLQIQGNRDLHPAVRVKSFVVRNEFGADLDQILSRKVRDSIDMHWRDYYSFELKK
ncbi:MAG TPA: hypothetical protein VHS53_17285 [Mucilaginibacter sp.]|nr:hypothetical protein [Mucilaginibacter sp.]